MAGFASAAPMIVLFAATGGRLSRGSSQPKPTAAALTDAEDGGQISHALRRDVVHGAPDGAADVDGEARLPDGLEADGQHERRHRARVGEELDEGERVARQPVDGLPLPARDDIAGTLGRMQPRCQQ